jgi:hypothetical protein
MTEYPMLTLFPSKGLGLDVRMYPYSAPDGAEVPYCFYNVISDATDEESFGITDTGTARIQFDFVTATKAGKSIALAARKAINHIAPWSDGVSVMSITCNGVRDIELTTNAWQWQFDAMVEYVRA